MNGRAGTLAHSQLTALYHVDTIESIGSSPRIERSKLSDHEIKQLLSYLQIKTVTTHDEQEVAGYVDVMELVYSFWEATALTENHIM